MACSSCKNAARVARINGEGTNIMESRNWLTKILMFFPQLLFGILVGCILVILIVPLLIYVIACVMFGIEPKIKLHDPFKDRQPINNPEFVEDAYKRMQQRYG